LSNYSYTIIKVENRENKKGKRLWKARRFTIGCDIKTTQLLSAKGRKTAQKSKNIKTSSI
jgi:hypothetical protein